MSEPRPFKIVSDPATGDRVIRFTDIPESSKPSGGEATVTAISLWELVNGSLRIERSDGEIIARLRPVRIKTLAALEEIDREFEAAGKPKGWEHTLRYIVAIANDPNHSGNGEHVKIEDLYEKVDSDMAAVIASMIGTLFPKLLGGSGSVRLAAPQTR